MSNKRNIAGGLGAIAAITLFLLVNPWIVLEPDTTVNQAVTIVFWVSFLALLVVLFQMRTEPGAARPSRSKAQPSPDSCSAIHGPASSGYRSASSSALPGWKPATTSSAARAGWTEEPH